MSNSARVARALSALFGRRARDTLARFFVQFDDTQDPPGLRTARDFPTAGPFRDFESKGTEGILDTVAHEALRIVVVVLEQTSQISAARAAHRLVVEPRERALGERGLAPL